MNDLAKLMKQLSDDQANTPYYRMIPSSILDDLANGNLLEREFNLYVRTLPVYRNPRMREVQVRCPCRKLYIVYLPDDTCSLAIPDIPEDSTLQCPQCGASIHEWLALMGHSGGHFNTARYKGSLGGWTFDKGDME